MIFPYGPDLELYTIHQETEISTVTGGGRRVRTDDPLLAKQVLSQLSYAPISA